MKNFNTVMKLGLLIGYSLSAGAALAHSPNGHTYKVAVFSSFNTQFNDCFTFDNAGTLTVKLRLSPRPAQHPARGVASNPKAAHIPMGLFCRFMAL